MTEGQASVFPPVLAALAEEGALLRELLVLANREQAALMRSDYEAISGASSAMLGIARQIDELESERKRLLRLAGAEDASLDEVVVLAEAAGVAGFAQAREDLLRHAAELRRAQESNARLVLAAMKLQERWIKMFGGLSSLTYAADGTQERLAGHRLMSRSA